MGTVWDSCGVMNIKNFNVVKLDSKGRIIIPFHIRDYIGLKEGIEVMITNNEKKELRIFPLLDGSTARIRIIMLDIPGSLSKILDKIAKNKIDILMSISKTIERGKLAEWNAIVDTSECRDVKKIEDELKSLDVVQKIEVEKK